MSRSTLRLLAVLWLGLLAGFAVGAEWFKQRGGGASPAPSGGIDLVGAGATFPYPLYRRWFSDYASSSGVRINYLSVGSGEGIRLLLEEDVDFGASDRPLSSSERSRARCALTDVPMVAGAIVLAYQLPTVSTPLRLDVATVAGIYLGRIRRWDAPEIRALNAGVALPDAPILPVFRVRTSGTSDVMARWLSNDRTWSAAQDSTSTRWPVGTGAEGNEGVASQLQVTPGAIGFVELSYARQSRLALAQLRNASGAWVTPTGAAVAAAAEELLTPANADTMSALVGATGPAAWPIVALTRLVTDRAIGDATRGAHFVAFARWALRDGAAAAAELGYAPLPRAVAAAQDARLKALPLGRCTAR